MPGREQYYRSVPRVTFFPLPIGRIRCIAAGTMKGKCAPIRNQTCTDLKAHADALISKSTLLGLASLYNGRREPNAYDQFPYIVRPDTSVLCNKVSYIRPSLRSNIRVYRTPSPSLFLSTISRSSFTDESHSGFRSGFQSAWNVTREATIFPSDTGE